MSVKTRLFLIRHAVVTETEGKVYGAGDVNCDCSDTAQIHWLAQQLPDSAASITSGLKRTLQTAHAVMNAGFESAHLASLTDLNEQCFGAWEGLSYDEIRAEYGASAQKFWLAPAGERPPSTPERTGESFHDLTVRTHRALQQITTEYGGQDIAIFAHGGTIRAALAVAMGLYHPDAPETLAPIFAFKVDNLSLSRIDHVAYTAEDGEPDDYWRVQSFNMRHEVL